VPDTDETLNAANSESFRWGALHSASCGTIERQERLVPDSENPWGPRETMVCDPFQARIDGAVE